jgi:lysophospholipase L1-like esterase
MVRRLTHCPSLWWYCLLFFLRSGRLSGDHKHHLQGERRRCEARRRRRVKQRKGHPYTVIALLSLVVLLLGGCSQLAAPASNVIGNTSSAARGQFTYVAIGASDTFGIGTDDPYYQNWASDLGVELGPRVHVINLGIPGILVHDALNLELPIALDSHPALITIWLAVNDIVAKVPVNSYSHDLNLLVSRLQAGIPHVIIAIANVPDLRYLPRFSKLTLPAQQALYAQMLQYNAAIGAIAHHHQIILVDLSQQSYNLKNHPEYISSDGFHPNDIGYLQLAELFYHAVQGPLRKEGKLR